MLEDGSQKIKVSAVDIPPGLTMEKLFANVSFDVAILTLEKAVNLSATVGFETSNVERLAKSTPLSGSSNLFTGCVNQGQCCSQVLTVLGDSVTSNTYIHTYAGQEGNSTGKTFIGVNATITGWGSTTKVLSDTMRRVRRVKRNVKRSSKKKGTLREAKVIQKYI